MSRIYELLSGAFYFIKIVVTLVRRNDRKKKTE